MKLAVVLLSMAAGACSVVTLPEPPGDAAIIRAAEWEGHWALVDGEETYVVDAVVADATRGLLEISGARLERAQVFLRQSGPLLLASVRESPTASGYLFFALSKERDAATLWIPDFECVQSLLRSGRLSGAKSMQADSTIELDRLDIAQALSRGSMECDFFRWDKPLALRRLTER